MQETYLKFKSFHFWNFIHELPICYKPLYRPGKATWYQRKKYAAIKTSQEYTQNFYRNKKTQLWAKSWIKQSPKTYLILTQTNSHKNNKNSNKNRKKSTKATSLTKLRWKTWFGRGEYLDLGLDIIDGVTALDLESDCLSRQSFNEDLHLLHRELKQLERQNEDKGEERDFDFLTRRGNAVVVEFVGVALVSTVGLGMRFNGEGGTRLDAYEGSVTVKMD